MSTEKFEEIREIKDVKEFTEEPQSNTDAALAASASRFSMEYTMKYFKHYKNKAYMFRGIAKHSETLEELVVYETRYENSESKLWVRPKKMFFEQVYVDGELKARFEQVPLFIQKLTQISEEDINNIKHLCELCFGKWNDKKFRNRLSGVKNLFLIMAYIETKPVAFKIGFESEPKVFYSWLGGVNPEFQGYGFGKQIALAQMDWCRAKGYKRIRMKTKNEFRKMLAMNLELGFDIVSTSISTEQKIKIIMEKKL